MTDLSISQFLSLANLRRAALGLLIFFAGFGAGCVTTGTSGHAALLQEILDATLPPTFVGDAHIDHKNTYFRITIDAGNLHKEGGQWSWDWLTYSRDGMISWGRITLGRPPTPGSASPVFVPSQGVLSAPAAKPPTSPPLR